MERRAAPHPERNRPTRAGLTRGIFVIVAAVAVGTFVILNGLDDDGETIAAGPELGAETLDATTDSTAPATDSTVIDDAGSAAASDDVAGAEAATDGTDSETTDSTGATDSGATDSTTESTADDPAGPAIRDPAEVSVLVLNGAGARGIAGRGSAILTEAGYEVLAPKNADFLGPSKVLYTEGFEAEADVVAEVFGVDPTAVVEALNPDDKPINDTQNAQIVVVVGQDGLIEV